MLLSHWHHIGEDDFGVTCFSVHISDWLQKMREYRGCFGRLVVKKRKFMFGDVILKSRGGNLFEILEIFSDDH